ncbi:glycine N-acyltransferase-like protein 3 isoform X2 [Babylonia areolata]
MVNPAAEQLICRAFLQNVVVGVYGSDDEALGNLLRDPSVVDWNTKTVFCAFSSQQKPVLQAVAEGMGKSTAFTPNFLLKASSEDLKPIPVPEGMKIRPISDADVGIVNSTWKFATDGSDVFIQQFIQQFPSVYLETEGGVHVGHMLGTSCGTIGMLYVNPEFRRKGYAKVIISHLAQKYFDGGDDACVFVEETNSPSLSLHQSLGFKVVPGLTINWMKCGPKGCCRAQLDKKCCV